VGGWLLAAHAGRAGRARDPWAQKIRAPSARTFARVFTGLDAEAFNLIRRNLNR